MTAVVKENMRQINKKVKAIEAAYALALNEVKIEKANGRCLFISRGC